MLLVFFLGQGTLPENQVKQLYKMARDCLDRGHNIFTTAKNEQRPLALFRLATPSPTMSPTLPNSGGLTHPSLQSRSQTLPSVRGRATLPPHGSRITLQSLGVKTGQNRAPSQTQALPGGSRNVSWPANQRGAGSNSQNRYEAVDGIPGGHGGDPRQKPDNHLPQPNK